MSKIPRILHYTFGLAADFGGKPWSLVHYVCLRSALEKIRPEQVFFYYQYEPTGPWWTLTRDLVTRVPITAPLEIFGNPLMHVAHRADVVRLQKLIEHGGIYLDADVLVHRSFDDLLDHSVVMGREASFGMANAVILAERQAPFLIRWLDSYRTFRSKGRDEYWAEHAVTVPAKMAEDHPDEITVLSDRAFFWPLWSPDHLAWMFESNRLIPLEETYANHLWEAAAWSHLHDLTPGRVRGSDTNFSRWARPYLSGLPDNYGAVPLQLRLKKAAKWLITLAKTPIKALKSKAKITLRALMTEDQRRRHIFQEVYKSGLWGADKESRFYSGVGSRGEPAAAYVGEMGKLLSRHAERLGRSLVVVDMGCGDFEVGAKLVAQMPDMTYIGCDVVPELVAHNQRRFGGPRVSFKRIDIVSDVLPAGDICLVRQVLQHLSNREISSVLERLDGYEAIYVTEGQPATRTGAFNPDKPTGHGVRFDWQSGTGRGVELDQPPFSVKAEEVFRTHAPPHEVIVTFKVDPKVKAGE